MKVAALDLGSNTFLCLICDVTSDHCGPKISKIYYDQAEVVRLGQNLSSAKKFHPDALARAKACLKKFKEVIDLYKPDSILAVATSAARDAENSAELFQICKDLEIPLEIIPGDKEAEITYRGATSTQMSQDQRLIVDIGGGSTEFIFGEARKILYAESFNIGCVRLTEKFILNQPTQNKDLEDCQKFIAQAISGLPTYFPKQILAVAGTPTTLAAVEIGEFSIEKIDHHELTYDSLQLWLKKLQPLAVQEKIDLGFPAGRADVILVGILILIETLKKFHLTKMSVSTRGVRYGVALEMVDRI